ncbi:hypothetical protein Vadar_010703 [Vaccinium darrowii]|uniref:Uncharacterized protein n=1 Tax=Vaccinium darrowii TaxID=229202 RepID=A0ACB7ZAN3_9ERIC|nr:hypothetical protein Vadar_010703 [Vaccinium darrowii]
MIDKEVLLALGKEGVVSDIARGTVIDEKALVRCLVDGELLQELVWMCLRMSRRFLKSSFIMLSRRHIEVSAQRNHVNLCWGTWKRSSQTNLYCLRLWMNEQGDFLN